MNKKVLDIWAIQYISTELQIALAQLKTNDVIVFDNTSVELKIGETLISDKIFSCVIFSEESDTMILIMKHADVGTEDVIKYLENNNIHYSLVSFLPIETENSEEKTPEIWFARDPYVVSDACDDSLTKNITNLTYSLDRTTPAKLKFKYLTSSKQKKEAFDTNIYFKGIITLEDKIILIVDTFTEDMEEKIQNMESILQEKGFSNVNTITVAD